ncbi:MAG TPA: single-stranded DNA-binding protein [Spirochaetota bacterium]|nr:single-stranded DNA-binding protein [Spirochaetota bacterium]HOL55935.1 single-stranded DNA-binding protein [Spirochaetota bacterium]HPP03241.1 single-stranded DNA-binding protein [Spirochaetota bacterium]
MLNPLNQVILEGNLTREPELLYTKNGSSVCKFDVAVNFKFKKEETEYNEVSYVSVTTWNHIAEACAKCLKKGSRVRLTGRLKQEIWTDKEGNKKQKLTVYADDVFFVRTTFTKKAA